ncbi:phage tail protein [Roseovarius sp. D22-M7]|uniref:phage tail protein n=1 Tax=Roseovarius sp. D22-M7 TaxID=3127116 RepID=UPI00300FC820
MAMFSVNSYRIDPYKNFKFRVEWDGNVIAAVSKVGMLKRTTEVVEHRDGGDFSGTRKSPGKSSYEAIALERGLSHDPDFQNWAMLVHNYQGDGAVSLRNFRKDISISLLNLSGQPVARWNVYRAWVSEFQAAPEFNSNENAVAIEMITLQHEGFLRDEAVTEPTEI